MQKEIKSLLEVYFFLHLYMEVLPLPHLPSFFLFYFFSMVFMLPQRKALPKRGSRILHITATPRQRSDSIHRVKVSAHFSQVVLQVLSGSVSEATQLS